MIWHSMKPPPARLRDLLPQAAGQFCQAHISRRRRAIAVDGLCENRSAAEQIPAGYTAAGGSMMTWWMVLGVLRVNELRE
jgi:hypothetical protein